MPRELCFQTVIPGCTIQEFNQIALSDETAISNFHREVTKDDTVTVTPWSDGRREVEFILAMSIPKSVQSFIGAGPIRIRERQCVTWKDESSLEIVSEPEVQISYAKSLVTKAELLVCGTGEGVTIDVKVAVNASVPWPMQGTVESLMADQAKKTVGQYVDWIVKYVEAALEDMNNLRRVQEEVAAQAVSEAVAMLPQLQQPQPHLETVGPPTPPESTVAVAGAAAAAMPPTALAPVGAAAAAVTSTALVPRPAAAAAGEVDVFFDADEVVSGSALELLLRELREAKQGREQTHRLLESIKESLQHVDYALTRELAFQEGMRHAQLTAAAGLSSSSSSYGWLLSIAATAAAASAAATYLVMRRHALS